MFGFFSGVFKAGLNTATALFKGPSETLDEMHSAQQSRYHAFSGMMTSLNYHEQQIVARKQYWCTQTYFLAQLIKKNSEHIQEIIKSPVSLESPQGILSAINHLIKALDDAEKVKEFLQLLEQDSQSIRSTMLATSSKIHSTKSNEEKNIHLFNGDVINLIKDLNTQGTIVITDNAANSHRDGSAKYSNGSLEELFSRYTDSALKMSLHFCDVSKRNGTCTK